MSNLNGEMRECPECGEELSIQDFSKYKLHICDECHEVHLQDEEGDYLRFG